MSDRDTFNDFINELIDKNDILEVVRGYVDLTRKGNSYWGRCPFHHEKTASFHVEERLKIYKCFGCGAAGNVIKFIQEIESVSFMEAVKILADRVGMKVPEFSRYKKDDNLEEKKKAQDRHYKLVAVAARYYNDKLMRTPKILDFLAQHGIDRKTIIKYGLGYSPNPYSVTNHLFSLNYTEKEIEDAGVGYSTENDKFQDVMQGRIVCPVINTFGKVAGFSGSVRSGETIYTKNTDIFRRENELFGTHLLKTIKMEEGIDNLIITSTPIDAVVLHAKGYPKVVSTMGNNINTKQARALMRYTDKFTCLYSDAENGIDKNFAGIDALTGEGGSVKIASLTEHYNMLEAVEKKYFDKVVRRMKKAKSLLEYQLELLKDKHNIETEEGKFAYVDEARSYIMAMPERSKQEPYITVLSKLAGVREDAIRKRYYNDAGVKSTIDKRVTKKKGKAYNAMITMLGLLEAGMNIDVDLEPFLEDEYKEYYLDKKKDSVKELSAYFSDTELKKLAEIDIDDKNNIKIYKDCLKVMKDDLQKRQRDEIIKAISEETDIEKKRELLKQLQDLMRG